MSDSTATGRLDLEALKALCEDDKTCQKLGHDTSWEFGEAARTALPALIEEVERLRAGHDHIIKQVEVYKREQPLNGCWNMIQSISDKALEDQP